MLKIRLQRTGRRNQPKFRVIVGDDRNGPKSGRFLEVLGFYEPKEGKIEFKNERVQYWINNGAQVTGTVHNFLIDKNIIKGKKVNVLPKKRPIKKEEENKEEEKKEAKEENEATSADTAESEDTTKDNDTPAKEDKKEEAEAEEENDERNTNTQIRTNDTNNVEEGKPASEVATDTQNENSAPTDNKPEVEAKSDSSGGSETDKVEKEK